MAIERLAPVKSPDQDIIDQSRLTMIAAGNRDAFNLLYVDYHRRLSRFLARFNADYAEVEEVINDTLYTVWKSAHSFDGRSKVSTWIFGIAYHQACNMVRGLERRQRKHQSLAEFAQMTQTDTDAASDCEHMIDARVLDSALSELPVEQRMAVEMCYYLGHSCEEIGQITECSSNTVKSRLLAARKALRKVFPAGAR